MASNAFILGEGQSATRPPAFNASNFSYWKIRMQAYVCSIDCDIWDIIENDIESSSTPSKLDKIKIKLD